MENSIPFERYDDEFAELVSQIEASSDPQFGQNLLSQANDLLQQMALEARSCPGPQKRSYLNQVKTHKQNLSKYKTQIESQILLSNRDGLMRTQDNNNMALLHNQNTALERARKTMEETEHVALEITEELANNRETLMSTRSRVMEVSSMTGRANRILVSMSQRETQQRMVMYGVAVALGMGFLVVLYTMWF